MHRRAFLPLLAAPALAQPAQQTVERWGVAEITLTGPEPVEPYPDVPVRARLESNGHAVEVDGFWDGGGTYRVRFSPDATGEWTWRTRSAIAALDGRSGRVRCTDPGPRNHGPVKVANTHHFAYADGSVYLPMGTTCYAWIHQTEALEQQTLRTLASAPFNKMRMCVFPKHYAFNANEPRDYPFEGTAAKQDFARVNPAFFRHLEARILDLQRLGIEADLILFHPYDRWGYATMDRAANHRYLRYLAARVAAYRNVWWSLANEYNFVKTRTVAEWEDLAATLQAADPYRRLASVHNGGELDNMYDHSRPWITHASLQSSEMQEGGPIRKRFGKPAIFDECKYEGNIPRRWGDTAAPELIRRYWLGTTQGCYVGHGETFADPNDIIWWSKGGVLKGESAPRIAFLRKLLEQDAPEGLTPLPSPYYPAAGVGTRYVLYYFDYHQPVSFELEMPGPGPFAIDLIDPWQMTVQPVDGRFEGKVTVNLPGRPGLGMRVRRIG